ncbi:MAG: hypothetical protein QOE36_98 [Gaiellaceae bacterium]|nr:hypothetical protein [Gaiellaceae bacterium]
MKPEVRRRLEPLPGTAGGSLPPGSESDSQYWDEIADIWEAAQAQALWREHSDTVNRSLFDGWLPFGLDRVLKTDLWDEAMGEGLYPVLSTRANAVTGVDISGAIVEAARSRYPSLEGVVADVRRLPFEDASFDGIVSNSSLDHFESAGDIVASIRELRRVLRSDGHLLLTLDNPANPLVALAKMLPRKALNRLWLRYGEASARLGMLPYYVGATYGQRRLRRLLAEEGFDVREVRAVVHSPRVIAVLLANVLENRGSTEAQERFLRRLMTLERLGTWPTRFVTGHFVAVRAVRR